MSSAKAGYLAFLVLISLFLSAFLLSCDNGSTSKNTLREPVKTKVPKEPTAPKIPVVAPVKPKEPQISKPPKEPYLVHFVGNSLTYNYDIPGKFIKLVKSEKLQPSNARVNENLRGGQNLGLLFNAFAMQQIFHPSRYIILQEQSGGLQWNSTQSFIGMYKNVAELTGAKIILYATWVKYLRHKELAQCRWGDNAKKFSDFAKKNNLMLAPVGKIWAQACKNKIKSPLAPMGKDDLGRPINTDHHAKLAGAYAAALSFIRIIFPDAARLASPLTFRLPLTDVEKIQSAVLSVIPTPAKQENIVPKDPFQNLTLIEPNNPLKNNHVRKIKIGPCRSKLFAIPKISSTKKVILTTNKKIFGFGLQFEYPDPTFLPSKDILVFRPNGTIIDNELDNWENKYKKFQFNHGTEKTYLLFIPDQTADNCSAKNNFELEVSYK